MRSGTSNVLHDLPSTSTERSCRFCLCTFGSGGGKGACGLRRPTTTSFAVSSPYFPADPQFSCADRSQPILGCQLPPSGGTGCGRFPVSGVLRRGTRLAGRVSIGISSRGRSDLADSWPCRRGWRGDGQSSSWLLCETLPSRLWKRPTSWTREDLIVHLEDIAGGDVSPRVRAASRVPCPLLTRRPRPTSPSNTTT